MKPQVLLGGAAEKEGVTNILYVQAALQLSLLQGFGSAEAPDVGASQAHGVNKEPKQICDLHMCDTSVMRPRERHPVREVLEVQ